MKKLLLILFTFFLILLFLGCQESKSSAKFASQKDAIINFIESNGVNEGIALIETKDNKKYLLAEKAKGHFFLGKLTKQKKGYGHKKLTWDFFIEQKSIKNVKNELSIIEFKNEDDGELYKLKLSQEREYP